MIQAKKLRTLVPAFLLLPLVSFFSCINLQAQPLHQKKGFTHQDTLRGSITPARAWWDVQHYALSVTPEYVTKSIEGRNDIRFKVIKPGSGMQIDLQEPMEITGITWKGQSLKYVRDGNVYFVSFPQTLKTGTLQTVAVSFKGTPREAVHAPWDGGWIWAKDDKGRAWMSVACQGLGASVWYPCKDHQSDEPDQGATLSMTVPADLVAVGNGRLLEKKENGNHTVTWTWGVVNPINNYEIIPYIGYYTHWSEVYQGEKGPLDCDYWVLDYNLEKSRKQFTQVASMLKCFEYWMGPYPFYEDGYKLVEAPHLGMEHQSAVAYGNHYGNGYLGRDLSGTGWGKKWDFIIVHESGHEWFGNNITSKDIADMWIHESFTNYSETLYTTCQFGVEAGDDYCIGTRQLVRNDMPVIGPYGVNQEGSGDMYYKGGNMLHTIRQLLKDDEKFRQLLRGLNSTFYHQTVTAQQVEDYMSRKTGMDLSKIFEQYLTTVKIPTLEYRTGAHQVEFRWSNTVDGFNMPVKVDLGDGHIQWITPTANWSTLQLADWYDGKTFTPDRNFYIKSEKVD